MFDNGTGSRLIWLSVGLARNKFAAIPEKGSGNHPPRLSMVPASGIRRQKPTTPNGDRLQIKEIMVRSAVKVTDALNHRGLFARHFVDEDFFPVTVSEETISEYDRLLFAITNQLSVDWRINRIGNIVIFVAGLPCAFADRNHSWKAGVFTAV
jgi:hypothetical protein